VRQIKTICEGAFIVKKLNFFCSPNAPYYIYGLDYQQSSAGIRVLHYLCHALNELGEEAYISADVTSQFLRTPKLTKKVISKHAQAGRVPIAVYPEIVAGNPFKAHLVARWLLNKVGHLGGEAYYELNEMLFVYQKKYAPEGWVSHPLYVPAVDGRIFNNLDNSCDGERKGACFYAHKYLVFGGVLTHHVIGATSLCQDILRSHEEIADILRHSEVLYCYEPSAIVTEALYCGCPVVIIPSDYIANNYDYQYLKGPGVEVAFDENALARAKETLNEFNVRLHSVHAELTLRKFVDLTQREMADRVKKLKDSGNQAALPLVMDAQDRKLSDYDLWRISRRASKVMPSATGEGKQDAMFHIAVSVPSALAAQLGATLASISKQHYIRYRVSVLSDEPTPPGFVERDGVRWVMQSQPGVVHALNDIIKEGEFDWLLMLEAGDALDEHALSTIFANIARNPKWNVVYTDEDIQDEDGSFHKPFFKSYFAIDCYRSAPSAIGGGMAIKCDLLQDMSGFRCDFEGAEQYDLLLRTYEKFGGQGIGHISDVLYHKHAGEYFSSLVQDEVMSARRRALQEHLARTGATADIENGLLPGTFHIRYRHGGEAAVSIIIPTLNGGAVLKNSVNGVVENTEYKNWELIVIDQESDDADTLAFLDYLRDFNNDAIRVISQPRSSGYPALFNAGARIARQDYLLFLLDSTQPLRGDWLDEMLGYAVQPGVGVVGAKGVGLGGTVSNAGYILGMNGRPADFHHLHAPLDAPGYFGRLQVPGNPSAVAYTCLLTEKRLFDELGGFDDSLVGGYSDVDYCLKVGKAGRRVVWTPFAVMFLGHTTELPTEVEVDEEDDAVEKERSWIFPGPAGQTMFDRWLGRIAFDPAYNRNLSLCLSSSGTDLKGFEIETLPALTWDPDFHPVPRILALKADFTGCAEYRIVAPMRALGNAGKIQGLDVVEHLSIPELARMSLDVMVFQRQLKENQIRMMELYARNLKAFRVYEMDDLMTNLQHGNQARQSYQGQDVVRQLRQALDVCDRFVVSTDFLAQEYRKFKTDIRVVPNYIERAKWEEFAPKRRQGRKPRVGWAGGVSHASDLSIIADVVKALSDEVEWVFFGLCPEGVRNLVEYHSGVPIEDYPGKLASLNLDLAIAPLEDVPFNHGKSNLKLLEYGMLGYPVVCTDMTPYQGAYPVTRVKNRLKHWVGAIREHVSDLDELARRGDLLRDYTKANWMLEDNLDVWLAAWIPS
jgi:GT2 family glycosyltransferase/glycosyltransferase involved in cell wall biosynthesis